MGAVFEETDLRESNLYWTDLTREALTRCRTEHARWPEAVNVAYGPERAAPPQVQVKCVHVSPLTDTERRTRAVERPNKEQNHG